MEHCMQHPPITGPVGNRPSLLWFFGYGSLGGESTRAYVHFRSVVGLVRGRVFV